MKSEITLFLFFLSAAKCNDIRLGFTQPQSTKLFSEIKQADPALWTRTDDIVVTAPTDQVISAIYVTDLRDDKDGEARIESGGIGEKSVTIGLKSPSILRGYKFEVEVYGNNQYNTNAGYYIKGASQPYYDGQYARKF